MNATDTIGFHRFQALIKLHQQATSLRASPDSGLGALLWGGTVKKDKCFMVRPTERGVKELSTDTPNKSSFNKPLPQTSFHWLNRGRVGIYSPVPVPWRWPPCLSAPPPNPMLSCKQQEPAWSFLCVSPSWVGSIFEESRNNKTKYRQNPEALQFLRAYLFFLHVTNYTFHAVFREMNHLFIFQLSIKVTILWNIKHLWRDSLHL